MGSGNNLNICLASDLDRFVRDRVSSGRNRSPDEVIEEGLRLLELQERQYDEAVRELSAKRRRGAAQAERGELVDPDEVLARIDRLKEERRGIA